MPVPLVVIGAPSSAGAFAPGQEQAPRALRRAGLLERLRATGREVVDDGDLPLWRWRPDRTQPAAQNASAVITMVRGVAGRVQAARAQDRLSLVIGGDCTVGIGTVAGHGESRVGLVYFDMHADLNTPESAPPGALDWMGVAHMLGYPGTVEALARAGPHYPLLTPEQVLLFAHRDDQARPWERDCIARDVIACITMDDVARDPAGAARQAVAWAGRRFDHLVIHFDVDVIDFTDAPLSENTGRNIGLSLTDALHALGELVQDPRVTAVTVTELNPDHGEPDDATLVRFVTGLAAVFQPQ
jgi:arginase